MASDKLLENQKKTAERLAKQAELERHQQIVDALASIKKNDTIMTQALIGFLSGATSKTEVVNQLKAVTTVTTVATLTNQSQMGGYLANPQIPAISNQAAIQSNINNVVVS